MIFEPAEDQMTGSRWQHPCGWLLKPDFKRTEQRRATIDNSNLVKSAFSFKKFFSSVYKRRWFVLSREREVLEYYSVETSPKSKTVHHEPLGQINMKSVISVRPSAVVDAPPHALDLICSDIHYTIVPESLEEMNFWQAVINREIKSIEDWNMICELENKLNLKKSNVGASSKVDFTPSELCAVLLSFHRPTIELKEMAPDLYDFFANVVRCLLGPSSMLVSDMMHLSETSFSKIESSSSNVSTVRENSYSRTRSSSTVAKCSVMGCPNLHYNRSEFCRDHSRPGAGYVPGAYSVPGLMTATSTTATAMVSANPASSSGHNVVGSRGTVTPGDRGQNSSRRRERRGAPATAATATEVPQEYLVMNVDQEDPEHCEFLRRIALREKAQELANIKTEDVEINQEDIELAKNTLYQAGIRSYLFEDIELGHIYLQFKTLDANNDGKITSHDIRTLVGMVDPLWHRSDDFKMQSLLSEYCTEWISSASVDGADEMTFVGYVKALIRKRSDEATNYGYPDGVPIPVELLQHPFWDLRSIVCSPCATELSGWLFKRGYSIPAEHLNSWKLRFFRMTMKDGAPVLDYFDEFVAQECSLDQHSGIQRQRSSLLHSQGFSSQARSVPGSGNPPGSDRSALIAAAPLAFQADSLADRAVSSALAAVDAPILASGRSQSRMQSTFSSGTILNVDNKSGAKSEATISPKGSIPLLEISLLDFSPKTAVDLKPAVLEVAVANDIEIDSLVAFKLTTESGRRYTLACCEEQAINWMAEFVRFSGRAHAIADWRRNWGSDRHTGVKLRDLINACSTMERFARYCDTKVKAHELMLKARTQSTSEDMAFTRRNVQSLIEKTLLSRRDLLALSAVGVNASVSYFQTDVVTQVCGKLLRGLHESYNATFAGFFLSSTAYSSRFSHATDIETASLSGPDGATLSTVALKPRSWNLPFTNAACQVCSKPFKGISMRSAFRRHACRACGNICCSSCCSTKIYHPTTDSFIDVCISCTLSLA